MKGLTKIILNTVVLGITLLGIGCSNSQRNSAIWGAAGGAISWLYGPPIGVLTSSLLNGLDESFVGPPDPRNSAYLVNNAGERLSYHDLVSERSNSKGF